MAFTKIAAAGIGSTETVTLHSLEVINNATVGGVLTYEDVTNVDSIGLITARNGIVVGSGVTLSKDGDGFYTGVVTATTFSGAFSGDGSALTGVANTDVIFPDKISMPDSTVGSINVGLGSDLQIYHHSSNNDSYISNDTGDFFITNTGASSDDIFIKAKDDISIRVQSNEQSIECIGNGAVELYYDDSKKLETASGGVTVTGRVDPAADSTHDLGTTSVRWRNIYGDTLYGDGSNLTGIAAGITTEAASVSGITTYLDLTKDDHELIVTGNNTISVIGGAQGTSHSLRLQNSGIATVTLDSTYFKFPSSAAPSLPTSDGAISMISFTVHKAGAVGVNTVLLAGASVSFG